MGSVWEHLFRMQAHETSMHCKMYVAQTNTQRACQDVSRVHDDDVSMQ